MFQHIRLERGAIAELVLARPDARNAMTEAMGDEVAAAVAEIDRDPLVRVLLVRGEGKAFCAGGDLGFLEQRLADTREGNMRAMGLFYRRFLSVRGLRVPTIAVLHGAAMGAGLCFALGCDLRLAARSAPMGLNFVRLGLHPGMGATHLLPALVGPAVAADLLLTGRTIDGTEAARLGVVNEALDDEALLPRARELAAQIASAGPLAVARCKQSLGKASRDALEAALDGEAAAQAEDYATRDLAEGVRAARERRTPVFEGK
jgi:enoyl-CoA hydratase